MLDSLLPVVEGAGEVVGLEIPGNAVCSVKRLLSAASMQRRPVTALQCEPGWKDP